jgi:hypothetical protein
VADVAGVLGGRALAPNACCEGVIAVEERYRPTAVIAATRVAAPGRGLGVHSGPFGRDAAAVFIHAAMLTGWQQKPSLATAICSALVTAGGGLLGALSNTHERGSHDCDGLTEARLACRHCFFGVSIRHQTVVASRGPSTS